METEALLISDIYAAALGRLEWGTVLQAVTTFLGLWLVQVIGVDSRNGKLVFTAYGGPGATREASLDYVRFYNTADPRIGAMLTTPRDQWMLSHLHHDATFVATNPFYRDFLTPHGGGAMAGTKVVEVDNVLFLLAMVGHHGAPTPDPAKVAFLPLLKHHLGEAFRNMAHLRETYAELDMARGLLGPFEYPMLLVDEALGLCHRNGLAAALLAEGDLFEERKGYLLCRRKADHEALTQAVQALRISSPPEEAATRQALILSKTDGTPFMAFLSAVRPQQTMGVFGMSPRVLIVMHDPAVRRTTLDPFILAECFGLTPAEARVAVQIADGASAKEIARRSGAALDTVRSHIRRVMEKTGVDRQANLIRLLLNLPVRAG